ncbi:hypothetical protein THTE_4182 [Thermogutta terrifontis]|jgi:hypothetical protein|uniref:Uncharacterized protein n=1 Tax=Thermogutta terrifontis TaxID=1331910 RepID=A0A286RLE5_9BACT|nr:hypothetical protein [Thermogutta terrifontis]ASV76783.1 hypothetical protein THTE_4182 [Thermogutta terrifontis]
MSDFEKRLQQAIERGRRRRDMQAEAEARRAMTEQELRSRHSELRLQLTDYIEQCLRKLQEHFPGFQYETVISERGWGAALSRDDIDRRGQPPQRRYSRIELVVRPLSEYFVLDLAGKATIRDKELFNRSFYQPLNEADLETFKEIIDKWVLEFAEAYAARS